MRAKIFVIILSQEIYLNVLGLTNAFVKPYARYAIKNSQDRYCPAQS
jgi:hypothetical protein